MRELISRLVAGLSLVAFLAPLVAGAEHATLLVFPLENLTGVPFLSWVSEGTSESICAQVRIPELDVVQRETRLELVEDADLPPNATLSRASMIRIAQLARADYLVFGSFSGTESALRIVLQILDTKTMKLGPDIVSTGPLNNLAEMENELAWQTLAQKGIHNNLSREEFHKRTRTVPNSAYLYFIRSLGAPDDQSQLDLLVKAIESYNDFPGALFRLGSYHFEKGECSRAVELLDRIPRTADHFQEARFMLGACHCKLGNSSKAIQAYVELLPFAPSMEVLNNLGVSYAREEDLPLAVNSLKKARELQSHPVVAMNLGILRYLQGDQDGALLLLDEAYKSSGGHGLVQYMRSRVLQALGRTQESSEALAEAVRMGIDPEKLKNDDPRGWTQYIFSPLPPPARK